MRIDAHHHLWKLSRGGYSFPSADEPEIHRDFGIGDLRPLLRAHGIDATILVQVCESEAETDFLLDLARETPEIAGVVGWTDLASEGAPAAISRMSREPLLVGLRPMVQGLADDDWLLKESVRAGLAAMAEAGLALDALIKPRHLRRLERVAADHPNLRIVIDHGAKPDIAGGNIETWRHDIARLGDAPNVTCKLSGLVTEAAPDWTLEDLRPVAGHLLAVFGPSRLLWGSDWPVVNLAGGYDRWVKATNALLADLDADARAAILGLNAADIYLDRRGTRREC